MNTNCTDQTVHLHLLFLAKIDLKIKWLVSNSKRWDGRVSASGDKGDTCSLASILNALIHQNMTKELL